MTTQTEVGPRADVGRVADGRARRARRLDRAGHDPPHLDASIGQLEWTVNAYTLSFAVLLMTGAALGDRFGRRRLFAAGLGLFVAASAACALAPSVGWLIAARAVQGRRRGDRARRWRWLC